MQKTITLSMGNGGIENQELIEKIIFRHIKNEFLERAEDATSLSEFKNPVFTTDSFTITPLFFKGGDIGKLAVAGACNDLAMMGAKPKFLSLSFIIEEGFNVRDFEKIVRSIKKELDINEAKVVTGDTKVVPKESCDGIYINISAIGERVKEFSQKNIEVGDVVLISGDIARHGASIFASREGIELENEITSDCKSLWPVVERLIKEDVKIKACRDATRGGVAAVLNEWAKAKDLCFEIEEAKVKVSDEVRGICEILGFEPFILANEGTFVAAVDINDSQKALEILKEFNENASVIGIVTDEYPQKVLLKSEWGTRRFLDMPSGEILPRIC
ncbi:hydrogenase expression/formation protein HypE [Nitrosophilus labii]|uniref:hydrogenase expression/formation protein HypE n=1 Tax=Nitrosophilus labii TaxID=2706014 RepID=UPI0016571F4A|nr:hydrogenase expression/formation protein HypE [Nitrosophilus labii]